MSDASPTPAIDAPDVWCCLPIHNNAQTIADIAARCRRQLKHVVIVDDGSTDASLASLLAHLEVTVLTHSANQGKGAALQTGFDYIRKLGGRYAVTLDGDGQHFPEDLPAMARARRPDTLVLGRRHRVAGHMPPSSLFGREFSDGWVELETGRPVRDSQSGFRVYPLQALAQLDVASLHYTFEVEVVTRALWAGLRVTDVPIGVWYPPQEERVSSFRPWQDNVRLTKLHGRLIARQLVPWPHHKITLLAPSDDDVTRSSSPANPARPWWRRNTWPGGLALTAGLAILLSLMHGPWGAVAVAYLAWRCHLNPLAALAGVMAGALMYHQPSLCMAVGGWFTDAQAYPRWAWFIGSHLVGPVMALAGAAVTYTLARQRQPLEKTVEPAS